MNLIIGNKKTLNLRFSPYIAVVYILIMSGSALQYARMGLLGRINMIVSLAFLTLYWLRKRGRGILFRDRIQDVFLLSAGCGLLISILLWGETGNLFGYLNQFCLLLLPWLICKTIRFERFMNAYLKVIFFLAVVSCLFYAQPLLLKSLPFKWTLSTDQWDLDYYFIHAVHRNAVYDVHKRNMSIFWEPGMYQGYLIFAMLYVSLQKKQGLKPFLYQAVMLIALLTTQSTTGYLLLIPVVLIGLLQSIPGKRKQFRLLAAAAIGLTVLLIALNPRIAYAVIDWLKPGMSRKLSLSGASMSTRVYGLLTDAYLAVRHPLGIGLLEVENRRACAAGLLNIIPGSARINTTFTMMLYYGLIPGALYLIMIIKGCMRISPTRLTGFLAAIILLIILNTEPHYLTLFFTTIILYITPQPARAEKQRGDCHEKNV